MTILTPPARPLTDFDLTEAERIIHTAKPGHVEVVVARPGGGKSRYTRQVIVDDIKRGKYRRVLWATQSIVKGSALGQEAQKDFNSLGVTAEVVYGKQAHKELKIAVPFEAAVRLAHGRTGQDHQSRPHRARLWWQRPDLGQTRRRRRPAGDRRGPHLQPGDGFADPPRRQDQPHPLHRGRAGGRGAGDPVCAALAQLARLALKGPSDIAPQDFAQNTGYVYGRGLYGEKFWRTFLQLHPGGVNWVRSRRRWRSNASPTRSSSPKRSLRTPRWPRPRRISTAPASGCTGSGATSRPRPRCCVSTCASR